MKLETHRTLWNDILHFSLDDPEASIKFSDKLVAENDWSSEFTSRAITEYKKFILLCCISPTGASPSAIVDEVWHLHLTYTHNYWKEFCGKVLKREIHHYPSKGGNNENEKHKHWYTYTLNFYKEVFGEEAPNDIWPQPEAKINTTLPAFDNSSLNYFSAYKKYFYILLVPFLLPILLNKLHPFALTGPEFLFFFGLLVVSAIVFLILVRKQKKEMIATAIDDMQLKDENVYALARFLYGKNRAIETSIVDLVSKGILIAERNDKFSFYPLKVDAYTKANNPHASNLLQHHNGQSLLTMKEMPDYYDEDLSYNDRLATLYRRVSKKHYAGFIITAIIFSFGMARIRQGINNDYPVDYLWIMLMCAVFALLIVAASLSAKIILRNLVESRYKEHQQTYAPSEPMLANFIFLGLASLAGSYAFANLSETFKRYNRDTGSSGGDSSTGCGSSCGSSCGGGGCGGCGGGD